MDAGFRVQVVDGDEGWRVVDYARGGVGGGVCDVGEQTVAGGRGAFRGLRLRSGGCGGGAFAGHEGCDYGRGGISMYE